MYITPLPNRAELPSNLQLVRSTLIAALVAVFLLITTVLPAEYGIDPTGAGRLLGLTSMGEIKASLAREQSQEKAQKNIQRIPESLEAQNTTSISSSTINIAELALPNVAITQLAETAIIQSDLLAETTVTAPNPLRASDQKVVSLKPGEATEIKLSMKKGARVTYEWWVAGGHVNFDTHGDSPSLNYFGYGKGLKVKSDKGVLEAAFDGKHGWFWRNRSSGTVTITLNTEGDYQAIKRMM